MSGDFVRLAQKYTYIKFLGKGTTGEVFLVQLDDGQQFAAKRLKLDKQHLIETFQKEIMILENLMHTNLSNVIEQFTDNNILYCIIEQGEDAKQYFQKQRQAINQTNANYEKIIQKAAFQIAQIFYYLDQNKIYHRDFKETNFIVDSNGIVKLIDFGYAKQKEQLALDQTVQTEKCGSPVYMAPEIISQQNIPYNRKCDIFSIGVTIYRLLCDTLPQGNVLSEKQLLELYKTDFQVQFDGKHEISDQAKNLIQRMLIVDPQKRCDFQEFYNNEWVQGGRPCASHAFKQDLVNFFLNQISQIQSFLKFMVLSQSCLKDFPPQLFRLVISLMVEKMTNLLNQEFELFPRTVPPKFKFCEILPQLQVQQIEKIIKDLKSLTQQTVPSENEIQNQQKCKYLQNRCVLNCFDDQVKRQSEKLRTFCEKGLEQDKLSASMQTFQTRISSPNITQEQIDNELADLFKAENDDNSITQVSLNEVIRDNLRDFLKNNYNNQFEKQNLKEILKECKNQLNLQFDQICLIGKLKDILLKYNVETPQNETKKETLFYSLLIQNFRQFEFNQSKIDDKENYVKFLIELCHAFCDFRIGNIIKWDNFYGNWNKNWKNDLKLYYQSNNISQIVFARVRIGQNEEMEDMELNLTRVIENLISKQNNSD